MGKRIARKWYKTLKGAKAAYAGKAKRYKPPLFRVSVVPAKNGNGYWCLVYRNARKGTSRPAKGMNGNGKGQIAEYKF